MGQPDINEMTLVIEWDGPAPKTVRWIDHEGCGGEGRMKYTPFTKVAQLIEEWVKHCAVSHDIHPPKPRCSYSATLTSADGSDEEVEVRCRMDQHNDSTKHWLEI
jgi:hypothetical protein